MAIPPSDEVIVEIDSLEDPGDEYYLQWSANYIDALREHLSATCGPVGKATAWQASSKRNVRVACRICPSWRTPLTSDPVLVQTDWLTHLREKHPSDYSTLVDQLSGQERPIASAWLLYKNAEPYPRWRGPERQWAVVSRKWLQPGEVAVGPDDDMPRT